MTIAQPLTLETLAQRLEQLEGEVQALRAEIRPEPELIWPVQQLMPRVAIYTRFTL